MNFGSSPKSTIRLLRQLLHPAPACGLLLLVFSAVRAQLPPSYWATGFSGADSVATTNGVAGKALDLSKNAKIRRSLDFSMDTTAAIRNFSFTIWVNTDPTSGKEYTIASTLLPGKKDFWSIGVTAEGAWFFKARFRDEFYEYRATAPRQSIRDGKWHLLALTYSADDRELRFYRDGIRVATYLASPYLRFLSSGNLTLGASRAGRNYRQFWKFPYTTQPFYTTWETYNGLIDDVSIYEATLTDTAIARYYRQISGSAVPAAYTPAPTSGLTVTTHNIKHGGNVFGAETGRANLAEILRKTDSDVYLIVETEGSGAYLADALGYQFYLVGSNDTANLAIISRYPIIKSYPLSRPFTAGGVQISLPGNQKVNIFSVCLDWQPAYFFYSFDNNESWSVERFLEEDDRTRGREIREILRETSQCLAETDSIPLIIGGDFDSGSHLDYVAATRKQHKGYVVNWNASRIMAEAGFKDSFREIYPDPVKMPGITFSLAFEVWMNDRIDFIYYKGNRLRAVASRIISEHPVQFPSDHAALTTTFAVSNKRSQRISPY